MADDQTYLTRGALLKCSCGSHMRRLNLPLAHGEQIDTEDNYKHPLVDENDCVVEKNIKYFGICTGSPKGAPNVVLKKYTPYGETQSEEIVEGPKCIPAIMGKWIDAKEKTYINDGGTYRAVTTKSYLMCSCGGRIEPTSSGLEYKGEQDG